MRNPKLSWAVAACMAATAPLLSSAAFAEKLDGSRDITCAVMKVVGCVDDGNCIQGQARQFELPEFIILDAEKKVLRADYESGHKAVSPVKSIERSGNHLVMQGVENSHGWDIAIDTGTGRMSGAGVGGEVSFLVFGPCTEN